MKKILITLCVAMVAVAASAQGTFSRKDNILSVGIGGGYGFTTDVKWEINVLDGICKGKGGIGVGAATGTNFDDRFMLAAQANFHYEFVDNLDTYAGLSLGGDFMYDDTFYLGAQVGTRYYFKGNPHWALMGEFGYGLSFAKIGFTYKF